MNKKMILYTLGKMMFVEGLLMLLPFITGLIYREKEGFCYLAVGAFVAASGALLSYRKPPRQQIHAREGFVIVAAAWIFLSLFGALPFTLIGEIPHYIDAFFEIVSGFTTTGSSILTDVEALSHASLFWRSFTLDRRYGDPGLCCRNVKRCQRIDPAHSQSRDARSNCRQACF